MKSVVRGFGFAMSVVAENKIVLADKILPNINGQIASMG
jgi:hypothetical protein